MGSGGGEDEDEEEGGVKGRGREVGGAASSEGAAGRGWRGLGRKGSRGGRRMMRKKGMRAGEGRGVRTESCVPAHAGRSSVLFLFSIGLTLLLVWQENYLCLILFGS